MGSAVTSFVLNKLLAEISGEIEDQYLEKVQQISAETFKFAFRGKKELLIQPGARLNLTRYRIDAPQKPSTLALILRKTLVNQKLAKIEQYDFDRVVPMHFQNHKFIIEFFGKGNMVLTDNDLKIIAVWRGEIWKDRALKRNETYQYPGQSGFSPIDVPFSVFETIFDKLDAVRSMALNLKLGGAYAEEICNLAGVDKNTQKPAKEQVIKLFEAMRALFAKPPQPCIQNNEVMPFPLGDMAIQKQFKTLNEAVDEFYLDESISSAAVKDSRVEKLAHRLAEQQETLGRFAQEIEENKQKGDLIYSNFANVQEILGDKKTKREKDGSIIVDLSD